jgi:hypothetical protein
MIVMQYKKIQKVAVINAKNVSIKEKSIKVEPNGLMKMIHVVFLSVSPVSLQSL